MLSSFSRKRPQEGCEKEGTWEKPRCSTPIEQPSGFSAMSTFILYNVLSVKGIHHKYIRYF